MYAAHEIFLSKICNTTLQTSTEIHKKTKDISCTDSQNCLKKVKKKNSNLLMTQLQKNNPTLSM